MCSGVVAEVDEACGAGKEANRSQGVSAGQGICGLKVIGRLPFQEVGHGLALHFHCDQGAVKLFDFSMCRSNHRIEEVCYRALGGLPAAFAAAAHFLEQYFTCAQSRSHFFRHANSRLQWAQGLVGK